MFRDDLLQVIVSYLFLFESEKEKYEFKLTREGIVSVNVGEINIYILKYAILFSVSTL